MQDRLEIVARHLASYRSDTDRREIEQTFRDILAAQTFLGEECRFLYWCCHAFGMKIPFPLPWLMPLPLTPMSPAAFDAQFATSPARATLFENLVGYADSLKAAMGIDALPVLVGGSFVDPAKDDPDDIDIVITVPPALYRRFEESEPKIKNAIRGPLGIDVVFLPAQFSLSSFRAFSRIMCLCNDLDVQPDDWQPFPIETIAFTPRQLQAFLP